MKLSAQPRKRKNGRLNQDFFDGELWYHERNRTETVSPSTPQSSSSFSWPAFRMVWLLLVIVVGAIALDVVGIKSVPLAAAGIALLIVVFFISAVVTYRAAHTERKTNIERSELSGILQGTDDAVIVYEEGFRVIFFNPAAEQLFHLDAAAVVGHVFSPRDVETLSWRTLTQVIFPSLAPRTIPKSKEGDYPQVVDISFTDPQLDLRVTTVPLADEAGQRIAFMKIVRDRTAYIAAVHSKGEFVTIASHQFRTPVTEIIWALESLAGSQLADTDKGVVQNALAASQGLERRIEDLLSIAKMEEGQSSYAFEPVSPVDFVAKVLSEVLPSAQLAGIKIYFDRPEGEVPAVTIDAKQLSLALVNLLENAIRYNVKNGEVIVKVDVIPDKPFVEISVKDSGIGIPPEDMAKLFNKFYRAENAMKVQTEGSGLGLYIVKGIVKAHGGDVEVESELNRGTTMKILLPTNPNMVPQHEVGQDAFL
jgi:signal transduction histidine kinase